MGLGGLDEEKQVQEEADETEKVVNLDEEKKRRKPFCYWTVGGKDYRLKLKAANVEKLENKYKCNIIHMIDDLPPLSVMLTIIQAAMQSWEHGVKYTDVQNLYDKYADEEGGNQISLYKDVIVPIMVVSGFFTEEMANGLTEALEDV